MFSKWKIGLRAKDYAPPNIKPEYLEFKMNAQSLAFYTDIAGVLQELITNRPTISVLDVGPRTAFGANYLGLLFHPEGFSRIKATITCCDTDATWKAYSDDNNKYVSNYVVGDVFDLDRVFDVVILSHTIEHIPEPFEFLQKLRAKARRFLIVATPFLEGSVQGKLISGHVNNIDMPFIEKLAPMQFKVYRALSWHQSPCTIFTLSGKA